MTERTIRSLAKELAGQFYEMTRSAETDDEKVYLQHRGRTMRTIQPRIFGKMYPTLGDYMKGARHGCKEELPNGVVRHVDDGQVYLVTPGWMHWYDMARQMMVKMLTEPTVHDNLKEAIMKSLVEDREEQLKHEAAGLKQPRVTQRHSMERRG